MEWGSVMKICWFDIWIYLIYGIILKNNSFSRISRNQRIELNLSKKGWHLNFKKKIISEHLLSPYYVSGTVKYKKYIKLPELMKSGTGGRWEVYSPLVSLRRSFCSPLFLDDPSCHCSLVKKAETLSLFLTVSGPSDRCSWNIVYRKKCIFVMPSKTKVLDWCWDTLCCTFLYVFSSCVEFYTDGVERESPMAAVLL